MILRSELVSRIIAYGGNRVTVTTQQQRSFIYTPVFSPQYLVTLMRKEILAWWRTHSSGEHIVSIVSEFPYKISK